LPKGLSRATQNCSACLNFVFAGAMSYRKSIDLILKAFLKLRGEGAAITLTIVGGSENDIWINQIRGIEGVTYLGQISQNSLYEVFSLGDCLLLPSRFDSFGMVVAEAMAAGMPAIVSSMTGARALVESEPLSGWVVSPDEYGVEAGMRSALLAFPDWVPRRAAAQRAAARFTWPAYRARVVEAIKGVMAL